MLGNGIALAACDVIGPEAESHSDHAFAAGAVTASTGEENMALLFFSL
jgi:hypothetical protein